MKDQRKFRIGDMIESGELRGTITKIENIPSPMPDGVLIEYAYLESCTYRHSYRHGSLAPNQYIELRKCKLHER